MNEERSTAPQQCKDRIWSQGLYEGSEPQNEWGKGKCIDSGKETSQATIPLSTACAGVADQGGLDVSPKSRGSRYVMVKRRLFLMT